MVIKKDEVTKKDVAREPAAGSGKKCLKSQQPNFGS